MYGADEETFIGLNYNGQGERIDDSSESIHSIEEYGDLGVDKLDAMQMFVPSH